MNIEWSLINYAKLVGKSAKNDCTSWMLFEYVNEWSGHIAIQTHTHTRTHTYTHQILYLAILF